MVGPKTAGEAQALQLWKAAEADFTDEKRHRAFIAFCVQTGCLPFAARLYAERGKAAPDDAAVKRYQEMVVAQALATIGTPGTPEGSLGFFVTHKRAILIAISALTLILSVLLIRKIAGLLGTIGAAYR